MFTCRVDPSLEMRLWEEHHADELFTVVEANRYHLRTWLTWADRTAGPDDTRAFIRKALEQFARHDGFHAGIWLDGRIIGGIGLHAINWNNRKTEIGYWLAESAQGRGVMTRSCRAVVSHLISELRLNRVEIRCATENLRSRAVPRRLGFREEGVLRQAELLYDRYVDHAVYSMLAGEWGGA
jgi:ribosomal-protein-serine acetyltransferase